MKRIIRGALLCAAIVTAGIVSAQKSKDMSVARGLNTFSSIVKELEMNYVDTINSETAFKDAIDAMLQTVDPYTVYYPKEDREDISQMTTGEYAGIGALLLYKDGGTYVSEPFENSPAYKGGLRAGDRLLKVDTVDVSKFTVDKVSKLLRGRPDTQVRIRVQRPYVRDSILNLTVTRAKIRNSSVPYAGVLPDSIGYIRITQFIEDTGKDVRGALDSFHAEAPGLKGVIIDLRGNGGGLLEQAVDVASNFVPKGTEIVRTIGRDKDATKIYKTMRKPLYPDMPVAVLTDGGTASASEILAGAMQDLDRGVLVGTRSFGKGLVQTTRPLPYGGVLKVTVAKYYTPSGRLIQSLDYKHRNPDGSAARVPDSLTHAYKTLHGRTIRDGGGLQPDSTVNWKKVNRLVYNVVSDNWSWDFANKFKATHPTISTADKFVITDSVYNEFKAFIDPKKFKYDSAMEEATEALRKVADEEGYINDETTAAFDSLKKLLTHNLDRDLDTHRKHIEEYLGGEIVSRYYFDRGRTQYGIRDDEGVDAARGIIKDKALYKRILSGK
jgi:carboxyl-terminal processing protease